MNSKTPKFDKVIEAILVQLEPHSKNCFQCKNEFEIGENDIEFLKKFKVPEPKMCPDCRRQKRLAFLNYTTLFKRKCDAPNHEEKMISSIPKNTKFPVYDYEAYWHGKRDWRNYGRDFDFTKNFSSQFQGIFFESPQMATTRDPANVNSEYTCYGIQLKNCYYTFGGMYSENDLFSIWPMQTNNSMDLLITVGNDYIYEGVFPENCYNCNFVYFSRNCIDCNLIYDCRNCSDCFGCVNLRNKKYCIWNEQYLKEEYFELKNKINLGDRNTIREYKKRLDLLVKSLPIRAVRNEHSVDSTGNYLIDSKKALNSLWALSSENISYLDFVGKAKDSYDSSAGGMVEKLCGTSGVGNNCFDVKFSTFGRDIRECEYTMNCRNCVNCFGCIGIDNAKFCVFNKQYSEDEYWKLVDKIKTKMLQDGEYGELFTMSFSPFPYNASLANIVFPISKEEVLKRGGWWNEEENELSTEIKLVKVSDLPTNIKDIDDSILEKAIISNGNGKPFRLIKRELDFYRQKGIAIPEFTPYERIIERFTFVNNFKIAKDKCSNCDIDILSSYDSNLGYKPYCEKCYQQEIY